MQNVDLTINVYQCAINKLTCVTPPGWKKPRRKTERERKPIELKSQVGKIEFGKFYEKV